MDKHANLIGEFSFFTIRNNYIYPKYTSGCFPVCFPIIPTVNVIANPYYVNGMTVRNDLMINFWLALSTFAFFIYYCRQESLRRNGVASMVNKSLKCCTWM